MDFVSLDAGLFCMTDIQLNKFIHLKLGVCLIYSFVKIVNISLLSARFTFNYVSCQIVTSHIPFVGFSPNIC